MLLQNSWRLTWWQGCFQTNCALRGWKHSNRLGTATEEMIEIFLAEGRLVSALQLGEFSSLRQHCLFPFTCFQCSTWWYILFSYPYSVDHKFFAIFHPKNFITLLVAVRANGLVDSVSARKFLEAADKTGDKRIFFTVFRLSLQKLLFCKKTFNWFSFQLFWGEKP